jgi:ribosome modulation factor
MTGFDSKRQMAQAKVRDEMQAFIAKQRQTERERLNDDDDTQVYADTLLIVYQRGFADGKAAAQRKPLTDEMKTRCPYTAVSERGAFYDGWLSAEAAHGIKEKP